MGDFFHSFHFLRPAWLIALPASIGLWWFIGWRRRAEQSLAGQIAPHLLRHLVIPPRSDSWLTPTRLLLPIWILSVLSLAGPSFRRQPSPFGDDRAPLMIVLRVSQSMTSQDLSPSRLERARAKLAMLLSERGSAGTGLVAYNGSAHLVLPVTNDSDVVNHMLESLQPDVMPVEGDALSEAISLAAAQNERTGGGGSILVVTDSARTVESDRRVNQSVLFYAILRDASELAGSGISDASKSLEASTQLLTADDADIRKILAQADKSIVDVVSGDATKWRDDGYWFVIPLAICSLAWARRGWSIEP